IKYINGYPDGTVRPDASITRAEVSAILFRMLSDAQYSTQQSTFPDVAQGAWYQQSVSYLASIGIVRGYTDGSFKPDAQITRAEFAAMVSGFDDMETTEANRFGDTAGHWAAAYINNVAAKGWVSGYPDGTYKPDDNMTRAEVVTVVNRMLYRGIEVEDIPQWAPTFGDITPAHWAYTAVIEAAVGHTFDRKETGYEIWTGRLN
ncbi:MAG: S-layer homology domain-containing protein, partial [Clostridiales bacterium]|nr:S-layer homology domain-containing protein [Clostridiales bacterium]